MVHARRLRSKMSATNGERAQSSPSVESDESSTATIKTAIKTVDPPTSNQHEDDALKDEPEFRLESRNPFADEEELEDIQLGGELDDELQESPNEQRTEENGTKENGHVARISVEDYEDQSPVVGQQPKPESPKVLERVEEDVKVRVFKICAKTFLFR